MALKLIGISGTNGAGKDTVGSLLADRFGYVFVTMTDALREEARRRGLPVERENLRAISAEWRTQFGLAVMIDRATQEFGKQAEGKSGLVLSSLRNPAEADRVHELHGIVLWVDANPKLRYERIQANIDQRGRSEDVKTFEQFVAEEQIEMNPVGGTAGLDMGAVKARADLTIMNEYPTQDDLAAAIAAALHI